MLKVLEVDVDDVPWKDDIVTVVPRVERGVLTLPSGPGMNCIKLGLPGKSILGYFFERIGLPEDLFSY